MAYFADTLPAGYPDRIALRIHPRTMLCATTWRVGASADETGFDELRESGSKSPLRQQIRSNSASTIFFNNVGDQPPPGRWCRTSW